MADDQTTNGARNVGKVLEIKGVVVDAVFPGNLPEINTALRITVPERDGRPAIDLIAEVQQHLGDDRVRAVAMDSTDGIPRGVDVVDTGAPISVPVGKATRSTTSTSPSRQKTAGRFTATLRSLRISARRPRSSRPASRSST